MKTICYANSINYKYHLECLTSSTKLSISTQNLFRGAVKIKEKD